MDEVEARAVAIYHLAERRRWAEAETAGRYAPESFDREGFIHLCTAAQLRTVADAFYRERTDLVLLAVDPRALGDELRWEGPVAPDGKAEIDDHRRQRFPHLYAELPVAAVTGAWPVALGADGRLAGLPGDAVTT